ncbi:MAG: FkbM family methyltransferase [Ruminococcaceae bacterium]|nr:FkbM family methyltransferase [Oscillospiraceae bacterium]
MTDLWTYLKSAGKPIVMYGMGNGADKIISVLGRYDIEVDDFFASDGFVRGQVFHGKKVLSFSDIREKYEDFIILVSFGSPRRDVLDMIYEMSGKYELYSPDVPLAGETLFDREYFESNEYKYRQVRELFADEESKIIFDNVISYKLSGKIDFLRKAVSAVQDNIFDFEKYKVTVDAGAYTGDTAREMLEKAKNIERIICLEPDFKNFKKLLRFTEENEHAKDKVCPISAGAWDTDTKVTFGTAGNRNSNAFSGGKENLVDMLKIDSVSKDHFVDYIKYDVEGAEMNALIGSRETIEKSSPDMLISLYHRSEDIFDIPLYIRENYPQYDLYLRRPECLPAWEINLCVVKK